MILASVVFCHKAFAADEDGDCLSASVELASRGESYQSARRLALAEGRRLALAAVAEELTLGGYDGEELPPPRVVRRSISSEIFAPPNYKALGKWCFAAAAVRRALGDLGIAYLDSRLPPVLIVPVLRHGGLDKLWEGDNHWRRIWEEASQLSLGVKVPEGSLGDKGSLSVKQAVGGEVAPLTALGRRYGADTVVVATIDSDFRLRLLQVEDGAVKGSLNGVTARARSFAEAMEMITAAMAERSRGQLFQPSAVTSTVEATACFADRAGWQSLRAALGETSGIRAVALNWLSRRQASISLKVNASFDELRRQLRSRGQALSEQQGAAAINC